MNSANGGLEVVEGSHKLQVPVAADNCLEPDWVDRQVWQPVELQAGDALIFGSALAHRSAANLSDHNRMALYATYNAASEGDLHGEYRGRNMNYCSLTGRQMNTMPSVESSGRRRICESQVTDSEVIRAIVAKRPDVPPP